MYEVPRNPDAATVQWRRLGRPRAIPVTVTEEDGDGHRRPLGPAATRRAWREICRAPLPPRPEPVRPDVPPLPEDQLLRLGWRACAAPAWNAPVREIREWMGPPPTLAEAPPGEDEVDVWDGEEDVAGIASESEVRLDLRADPDPELRGWDRPREARQVPVGFAPRRDGGLAEVGAHARRRADHQSLDDLLAVDAAATDPYSLIETIAAWNRLEALAAYHKRMLAHELASRRRQPVFTSRDLDAAAARSEPVAAQEVAFRLGITHHAALGLIHSGAAMAAGPGILTGAALEHGEIDARKADLLIERTSHLHAELAFEAQAAVVEDAALCTAPQIDRRLRDVVAALDPQDEAARHARARRARRVGAPRTLPDGMASTSVIWPAADAVAMHTALEAAARTARASGDDRTLEQLRCDALATMAHGALRTGSINSATQAPVEPQANRTGETQGTASGALPKAAPPGSGSPDSGCPGGRDPAVCRCGHDPAGHSSGGECTRDPHCAETFRLGRVGGAPAEIRITVPLTTLMGQDEQTAELEGYGPIPATVARAWAAGGVWRRLVTDPVTERAVELTERRYRPPGWLREQILAQSKQCVAPSCSTDSRQCDLDHGIPFPTGPTAAWNLHPLCRRHHRARTHDGFDYRSPAPGVYEWSTPSGHVYRTEKGQIRLVTPQEPPLAEEPPPF